MRHIARGVVAAALAATALGGAPSAGAAKNHVISMDDNFFAPVLLRITPGDTVQWRNDGGLPHTATTQAGAPQAFDIPQGNDCTQVVRVSCQQPGETRPATPLRLSREGTYNYFCKLHGSSSQAPSASRGANDQPCGMCAIIVVRAQKSGAAPGGSGGSPSPKPSATEAPTADATPEPSPSATVSPTATPSAAEPAAPEPSPSATGGDELAAGETGEGGGGGAATAVAAILVFVVARLFWRVWRPRALR